MRRLLLLLSLLIFLPPQAHAQNGFVVSSCGSLAPGSTYPAGVPKPYTVDINGETCISGTISASTTGFRSVSHGTPISVTTGGVSGTLPTNTGEVVATNVGTTNGAYCALGASATTSDQYIAPNGGWFAFAISGDTQLTCITSTSTTTVNMVGGSGLPTGTGGGGGGSGGAVTAVSGAFVDGAITTIGTEADAAWTSGSGTLISIAKSIANSAAAGTGSTGSAVPASAIYLGINSGGNLAGWTGAVTVASGGIASGAVASGAIASGAFAAGSFANATAADPCMFAAKTNVAISMTGTTTVKLVSLASSQKIYICALNLRASAATVWSIADGTKVSTECDTAAEAVIGATTATHGASETANGGNAYGNGMGTIALTNTAAHDLCLFQSGSGDLSGNMTYVQRVP